MDSLTRRTLVAVSYLLFIECAFAQEDRSLAAVDVRLEAAYSPASVGAIAQIGQPSEVVLSGKQSVRDVIRQRCGIADPAYIAAFLAENNLSNATLSPKDLETTSPGKRFSFPYCLRSKNQTEVINKKVISALFDERNVPFDANGVERALRIRQSALQPRPLNSLRIFGNSTLAGSDVGFAATENAIKFLKDNPHLTSAVLTPGQSITIDQGYKVGTVPLRLGITQASAIEKVRSADPAADVKAAVVADLIDGDPPIALLASVCTEAAGNADWPIPLSQLRSALVDLATFRPPGLTPVVETVMLIDTGHDGSFGTPGIPAGSLGKISGVNEDDLPIYAGINSADPYSNDATPPPDLKTRLHGGEVASTMLGGRFLPQNRSSLRLPKIVFASIAKRATNGSFLDIGGIPTALRMAAAGDIKIVNASVAATERKAEFITALTSVGTRVLVVVAAGNVSSAPQEFQSGDKTWPGAMGGNPPFANGGVIVSVGAHDVKKRMLYFSRRSQDVVDLAAPGCQIPTYTFLSATNSVGPVNRNGTSYSAPIVSYIASIMASEGLRPARIKDRLIISVDVNESLSKVLWSGGTLNVYKALSLWRDIADYAFHEADGSVSIRRVVGQLISVNKPVSVCGGGIFLQKDLRKLTRSSDPDNPEASAQWRGWRAAMDAGQSGIIRLEHCDAEKNKIDGDMVFNDGSPDLVVVPMTDIRDFVARYPS